VAALVEPEARVVRVSGVAAGACVRDVDEVAVDSDADRSTPPEAIGEPATARSEPSCLMRSTEIWLLPASTASRKRPSALSCSDPCDASAWPVPEPPTANGDPGIAVRLPSA